MTDQTPEQIGEQLTTVEHESRTGIWVIRICQLKLCWYKLRSEAEYTAGLIRTAVTYAIYEDRRTRPTILGSPLSDDRLNAIMSWADDATPGPWSSAHVANMSAYSPNCASPDVRSDHQKAVDSVFAADARQAVPEMKAHIDFLTGLLHDACEESVAAAKMLRYRNALVQIACYEDKKHLNKPCAARVAREALEDVTCSST